MGNNDDNFILIIQLADHIAHFQHTVIVQATGRLIKDKYILVGENSGWPPQGAVSDLLTGPSDGGL